MTLRELFLSLLMFILPCSVLPAQNAQKASKKEVKSVLAAARTNIKNGTNLDDAEQSVRKLLADSANTSNGKIWLTLFEAIKKRQEQLNEKLYLKQSSDTAAFLGNTLRLFAVLESMDSIDARPGANGVSQPRYRSKHAAYLAPYRRNIYSGGGYFLKKQDYGEAYKYFDCYLDCRRQPLFSGYDFEDKELSDAAFRAVYCGYKLRQCGLIDKYSELALQDKANEAYVLQYMAEACAMRNDTASYHKTLLAGFDKYPGNPYFFKYLAMFYSKCGQYDSVLDISERLLSWEPDNISALIAKSSALLHEERYEECIAVSDSVIARDASKAMPYLNAGLAYYNRIAALGAKKMKTKAERIETDEMYKKALPYFEQFRRLEPDAISRWGKPLYDIYYNLNMGDEFEEMEKLLGQ